MTLSESSIELFIDVKDDSARKKNSCARTDCSQEIGNQGQSSNAESSQIRSHLDVSLEFLFKQFGSSAVGSHILGLEIFGHLLGAVPSNRNVKSGDD